MMGCDFCKQFGKENDSGDVQGWWNFMSHIFPDSKSIITVGLEHDQDHVVQSKGKKVRYSIKSQRHSYRTF